MAFSSKYRMTNNPYINIINHLLLPKSDLLRLLKIEEDLNTALLSRIEVLMSIIEMQKAALSHFEREEAA